MLLTTMIIGEQHFTLASEQDPEALLKRIEDKLHEGGGFVEVQRSSHRVGRVLVSPAISMTVETVDVEEVEWTSDDENHAQSWFDHEQ